MEFNKTFIALVLAAVLTASNALPVKPKDAFAVSVRAVALPVSTETLANAEALAIGAASSRRAAMARGHATIPMFVGTLMPAVTALAPVTAVTAVTSTPVGTIQANEAARAVAVVAGGTKKVVWRRVGMGRTLAVVATYAATRSTLKLGVTARVLEAEAMSAVRKSTSAPVCMGRPLMIVATSDASSKRDDMARGPADMA
ncbi:unnamed protein product [Cyclocybe aegerita]|uniref:Antifreeze protein n=1 Tax=Cyclocybe aegerita TaxID=1973307 RepID=A0A8S0VUU3_CYCAE|nr:unnamed protein product [Cyclocybe aegerita]